MVRRKAGKGRNPAPKVAGHRRKPANCRPRAKGEIQRCILSPEEIATRKVGIADFITKNHLHPNPTAECPQIVNLIRASKSGTLTGRLKTIGQYRPYWKELGRFAVKVGDFRTAAICDDELRPSNPLPADPDTIILWIQYKSHGKGCPIVNPRSSTTIAKYANGDNITAVGEWNAPVNIRRARTALNMLHQPFELCSGEKFTFACAQCVASNAPLDFTQGGTWSSCAAHSNGALLRDRGNPTTELQCEKAIAEARNLLKENHSVRGNIQMTPAQVRSIRKNLFESGGGGNMYNMQTYVMMLLGINLFLRASEVITLGFDNFQMNAAEVEFAEHRVDSLVLWVKGKNDAEKVFFRLYCDDDNPEFCPVCHLLCYIQASGLQGGCLFPQWNLLMEFLDDPSSGDGVFDPLTQHVQYQNFLDRMQVSQLPRRLV
jgi:hypothetical protein